MYTYIFICIKTCDVIHVCVYIFTYMYYICIHLHSILLDIPEVNYRYSRASFIAKGSQSIFGSWRPSNLSDSVWTV